MAEYPDAEFTERIIGGFFAVHHDLGFGHIEAPYRRALAVELQYLGLAVQQEVAFELVYRGVPIGSYRADLIVESKIIVETKAGASLDPSASAQVLTYLKASGLEVGLILHFGPKPAIKRVVLSKQFRSIE
jgi:GxxExxY protein